MKIENISMQIKNEKSCARSMTDEDLVRPVRPGLTAVGPFMFHVCNIFSLHVQFLICMFSFLICSNIFNLHVWAFRATLESPKNPKKVLHSHVNTRLIDWWPAVSPTSRFADLLFAEVLDCFAYVL